MKRYVLINFAIVCCCFLMGIGYASVTSIPLEIFGNVNVDVQNGIFITDVNCSGINGAFFDSLSFDMNMLISTINLSNDSNSMLSCNISMYNNTSDEYVFDRVAYSSLFYDNDNIEFDLNNLSVGDSILSNGDINFDIVFKYKNGSDISNSVLNSNLGFLFKEKGTIYSVSYINVSDDSFPTSVIENGTLRVILEATSKERVFNITMGGNVLSSSMYSYDNNVLEIPNVNGDLVIEIIESSPYMYFINSYTGNGSKNASINLVRSDGATSSFLSNVSSFSWNNPSSSYDFISCASSNTSTYSSWCISRDSHVYYKTSTTGNWNVINNTNDFIDSSYNYFLTAYSTSNVNIVRSDGRFYRLTTNGGVNSGTWSNNGFSGYIEGCSSYNNLFSCVTSNGGYFYRNSLTYTNAWTTGNMNLTSGVNVDKVWVTNTTKNKSYAMVLVLSGNYLYNTSFSYNANNTSGWTRSLVPGGGVYACAGEASNGNSFYCLGKDGYIYTKGLTDTDNGASTGWTNTNIMFEGN